MEIDRVNQYSIGKQMHKAKKAKKVIEGGGLMFNQLVKTALDWKPDKRQPRKNAPRKIGESGERRIIRMAKAGYNVWEAWQILGTYDYTTVRRVYEKHGYDSRGWWV